MLVECRHPCTQLCYEICQSECGCNAVGESSNTTEATSLLPKKEVQARNSPRSSPLKKEPPPTPSLHRKATSPEKRYQPRNPSQHETSTHGNRSHKCPRGQNAEPTIHSPYSHPTQNWPANQAFRAYAAGGYIASDKDLAAQAEQDNAKARAKRL